MIMNNKTKEIFEHFQNISERYDNYKNKNNYYYTLLKKLYRDLIPDSEKQTIVELGCGSGDIIGFLNPKVGIGIDISPKMIEIASKKYVLRGNLIFCTGNIDDLDFMKDKFKNFVFDYCIMPDTIEHLADIEKTFFVLSKVVDDGTRVIITWVNPLWAPLLHILEAMKLKMPEGPHHWPSMKRTLFDLQKANFRILHIGYRIILPMRIPLFSDFVNRFFYKIPIFRGLCLIQYVICQLGKNFPEV
jgi:ubiquinone/menaquinone biosynthesis C-methylase UbiE